MTEIETNIPDLNPAADQSDQKVEGDIQTNGGGKPKVVSITANTAASVVIEKKKLRAEKFGVELALTEEEKRQARSARCVFNV